MVTGNWDLLILKVGQPLWECLVTFLSNIAEFYPNPIHPDQYVADKIHDYCNLLDNFSVHTVQRALIMIEEEILGSLNGNYNILDEMDEDKWEYWDNDVTIMRPISE